MTGKLSIVASEQPHDEEEQTFRESVKAIAEGRRSQLIESVQRWIALWAEFGAEALELDDFPVGLSRTDRRFIADWLEDGGFEVKRGRWNSRVTIVLED